MSNDPELKALCELYEKVQLKTRCMDLPTDGYDTDETYFRPSLPKFLSKHSKNTVRFSGIFKDDPEAKRPNYFHNRVLVWKPGKW